MKVDWKGIVNKLCWQHLELGVAAIDFNGDNAWAHSDKDHVPLSQDDECLAIKGRALQAKKVRRWLFEKRKSRQVKRKTSTLWSVYDNVNDTSWVGLGALTKPEAAAKMEELQEQTDG